MALLYPGRVHSVAGESESGKSWLALLWVVEQLQVGGNVVYVDFEDDEQGVVGRLLDLGVDADLILRHLRYVRPEREHSGAAALLIPEAGTCALVVIDGVTEMMGVLGLKPNDDVDVADMLVLPRGLATRGAAVVLLDHVVKDRQSRGRFATGSQHKLSGINGAAYLLEVVEPFAEGKPGRSTLLVAKDRPGAIRGKATKIRAGQYAVAQLVVDVAEATSAFTLTPYEASSKPPWSPTGKMQRASEVLAGAAPEALSYNNSKSESAGSPTTSGRPLMPWSSRSTPPWSLVRATAPCTGS